MMPKLLIEASAGCGKTYRIEKLVLDLLEEGFEMNEMVIVTFTRAQASDLRARIFKTLKTAPSKKAKRALQLFDEANISTFHSMAIKILQEKGPDIDFHFDNMPTLTGFKKLFAASLRHIPHERISNGQINHLLNRDDLLKDVYHGLGLRKEKRDSEAKLQDIRSRYPLNAETISRHMPNMIAKGKEPAERLIQFLNCSTWDLETLRRTGPFKFGEASWSKNAPAESRFPENVQSAIEELNDLYEQDKEGALEALTGYCRDIRDKDFLSYDDFIHELNELSRDESFQAYFRERYKIAIIDEFQDTDEKQWAIFERLFERIYLVGDPKQSIYRFRNADIYTYRAAKESIGRQETLDTNWRSDPALLDKLNRFFLTPQPLFRLPQENSHLTYEPVKAGLEGAQGRLIVVKGEKEEDFVLHMANRILREKNFSEWACLVSKNDTAEIAAKILSDLSIPYYVQKRNSLAQSTAGLSLFQILMAMKKRKSIKAALVSPLMGYSDDEIALLDDLEKFEKEKERFEGYLKGFEKGFAHFVSLFENDFLDRLRRDPPLFYEWEALVEEILEWTKENDFDSFYESSEDKDEKSFVGDPKGVKIMTIHSSKGLQFKRVFVLGTAEKPNKNEDEEERAEKMRLLYVALTRAETDLYIAAKLDGDNLFSRYLSHWPDYATFLKGTGCEEEELNTAVFRYEAPYQKDEKSVTLPIFKEEKLSSYTLLKKRGAQSSISLESRLPKGAETGIFLHEILEKIPQFQLEHVKVKGTSFEGYETDILDLFEKLFNFPLINGKTLKELSGCRMMREVPFAYPDEKGIMHGFIDLVIEVDGEVYIIDWKSHLLPDYSEKTLLQTIKDDDLIKQAEIYHEAAERFFGSVKEVLFVFLRGPGVYRWNP